MPATGTPSVVPSPSQSRIAPNESDRHSTPNRSASITGSRHVKIPEHNHACSGQQHHRVIVDIIQHRGPTDRVRLSLLSYRYTLDLDDVRRLCISYVNIWITPVLVGLPLILTCDHHFQSPASNGHHQQTCKKSRTEVISFKNITKTKGRTRSILLPSSLTRWVTSSGINDASTTLRTVHFLSYLSRDAILARNICCRRVSVRPNVTSRYCIETTGRIRQIFGMHGGYSTPIHRKFGYLQKLGCFPLQLSH